MKRMIPLLLSLLLLTGCGEDSADGYQQISQEEAKAMMDTQVVIILDVREQDEYDSGHIPGAVLLPVGTIDETTAAEVIPEKDSTVLVYCRSGNRSKTASAALAELGYTNIYDVLLNGTETAKAISSTSYGDVLPSNKALAGATIEMIALEQREYRLKNALEQVAEHYDYIFIDCPPSLELLTLNALCAADTVLVPVQCEYYALEGLSDLLSTIRIVKRSLNPKIALEGVVLTMYDGRTNLSMQVAEEVKRHFPGQVYATVIPRNVRLSEAPSFGKPVSAYDALSRGAEAYDALAQELLEHNQYAVTRVERKD